MKKLLILLSAAIFILGFSINASAISLGDSNALMGGDAATMADADVILDIAFAIDTSGSMRDEGLEISDSMNNIITNLDCADCDVWVRASFFGIYQGMPSWGLFDTALDGAAVDHWEDNAPAVSDLAANGSLWSDSTAAAAGQDYYRAIVTIGDEGSQDGEPGDNPDDYAAAYAANQDAIYNDILLFTIVASPDYGAGYTFALMSEGGAYGTYLFGDTGGTNTTTSSTTLEADIEEIICTAAGGGTGGPGPTTAVPEPATLFLLGSGLLGIFGFRRKRK